jgi:hypothetical protein
LLNQKQYYESSSLYQTNNQKSIHLVYATCMNDVIIYSKQTSNISYLSCLFYRVQPTFIADTVFMNTLQNEVLGKLVTSYRVNLSLAQVG